MHIYECISLGREYWYSLHLTTDYRYTLREMQPNGDDRKTQFPDWWIRGSGQPYPGGDPSRNPVVYSDIAKQLRVASVVVVRDPDHPKNLSGGREVYIPERYLYGLIPQALLDAYLFWKDESLAPRGAGSLPVEGYKRLMGYGARLITYVAVFHTYTNCLTLTVFDGLLFTVDIVL